MKVTNDSKVAFNNIYKMEKVKDHNNYKNKNNADRLELSELGKYLSKVNSKEEVMDMEKVNKLKKQIESGTYKIDSRALAKKIIEKL
ncbi:flagellar biosynthesis anti-sigma factor FlgM [Paraclostridium sordellii]|uniref:flagellar biosynthesis anti-sigma factor FlgM n=1 Tax=Paraclostridium sordellii TaxID=1505 RepID=UPI0005DAB612|nr:flagellar biosynthesis anti-sigma factor FlgM [Paeniclostridium sordellii]MCQ4697271.1 flagellar biosynthesis anti-sigma factor FlgM [Paeniclostridium sordellii]MDU2149430.1 flagellar biosynthesis anti-sigma factor FlgM [Paeniclostridium sordellii]MDU2688005.1 flagellar biosynthesis anti-sigma factor FlgM [Paeniclostridium sordellii]MDU4415271.1 flagellar biosynthesis anti-sigma factor FlgM [Paeniclostridium sordellii]MDU6483383.1 flagellar biosynthesis anti-sigma factor FlgM [Paeniclostrid